MSNDLDSLQEKIAKVRKDAETPEVELSVPEGANQGMRAASEFMGYVIAGIFMGYLADTYLGLKPVGIILMPILGLGVGVWRANQAMNNNNNKK